SVLQALTKEAGNMPQGVVVLSDGHGTLGAETSLSEAHARAAKDRVPIFSVLVGEDRPAIEIRITDVQTPEQTPPNEKFVVRVELDGIGLPEQETTVYLDTYAPPLNPPLTKGGTGGVEPTHTFEAKVKFQPGAPPHTQAEFALD